MTYNIFYDEGFFFFRMAAEVGKSSGLHQPELLCLGQKSTSETRTILKDLEADRRRIGYKRKEMAANHKLLIQMLD